jgi:glycosyltransferase involved in cell wall biosynthesis
MQGPPTVRVLPWPLWTSNPYLDRFCREIGSRGVEVVMQSRRAGLRRLDRGDWVHLHWPGGPLISPRRWLYAWRIRRFAAFVRTLKREGLRLAWTAHNLYPHDDPHPDLGRRARHDLIPHLDHVFVHFPSAITTIADELGYRGPTTVIPHGNYIDDYGELGDRSAARAQLGLPADGFVALMLGQLRPYKGIGEAVTAFMAMAGEHDRLVIAGRSIGDIGPELAVAAGDPRVIIRIGHVPAEQIGPYHAAADCFVAAHRSTFTSGSAVMALSLGCPIVGPAVHHLASLGPQPRLWATDGTVQGLAEGLRQRKAAGPLDREAIREWAREHLSWASAGELAAAVFLAPPVTRAGV